MVPGPPGPHATGIPHPAIVNPQVKHEPLHETDIMHMWVFNTWKHSKTPPLLPLPPVFCDDIPPGICVCMFTTTVGTLLNKPSVTALFPFPWCEPIRSQGPCTTDNRPMLHLASGITAHLANNRYRTQIRVWENWIHVPCAQREILGASWSGYHWYFHYSWPCFYWRPY